MQWLSRTAMSRPHWHLDNMTMVFYYSFNDCIVDNYLSNKYKFHIYLININYQYM